MHQLLKATGKYNISTYNKNGKKMNSANMLLHHGFTGFQPQSFKRNNEIKRFEIITPCGNVVNIHNNKAVTFS